MTRTAVPLVLVTVQVLSWLASYSTVVFSFSRLNTSTCSACFLSIVKISISFLRVICKSVLLSTDNDVLDADVRRTHADRQGELAGLAAAAAGVQPLEIVADHVDVPERGEQVPGQDDVLDHLSDPAVADHVGVAGAEGEIFQLSLAAVSVAGVDAELDILDHVLESSRPVVDGRVGHAHDGSEAVVDGARVAGGCLAHLGRGLAGMQAPDQHAILDEPVAASGCSFVVVQGRAAQVGDGAVVVDVEDAPGRNGGRGSSSSRALGFS